MSVLVDTGIERPDVLQVLCRVLTRLACAEDDEAATEAARTTYWRPVPASVDAHRGAARVLRRAVAELEASSPREADAWESQPQSAPPSSRPDSVR